MPDWWDAPISSPYIFLILAGISFTAAVVWTCTGKAWIRFHGWVYRSENSKRYWLETAAYYLVAVFFFVIFLYKAYGQ